ncbi:MAG: hypothetical protein ABEK04_00070, partial [Candidatus Nanohalobium sp.]
MVLLVVLLPSASASQVGIQVCKHDDSAGRWECENREYTSSGWSGWSGAHQPNIDVDGLKVRVYSSNAGQIGVQSKFHDGGGSTQYGGHEYTSSGWSGWSSVISGWSSRGGGLRLYTEGNVRIGVEFCKHDDSAGSWECHGNTYSSGGWTSWSGDIQSNNDVDGFRARIYVEELNNPPSTPSNPNPSDGETIDTTSPTLSVDTSDSDSGDSVEEVRFYNDASSSTTYTNTYTLTVDSEYDTESVTINSPTGQDFTSGEIKWIEVQGDLQSTGYGEYLTGYVEGTNLGDFTTGEQCGGNYERELSSYNIDSEIQGKTSFTIKANPAYEVDVDCGGWTGKMKVKVQYTVGTDRTLIDTDNNLDGNTASVGWSGLNCGQTYNWFAVADDGSDTSKSSTFSFDIMCNKPPASPSNPTPSDGSTIQDSSPTLKTDVSDPNGEGLNVEFFKSEGWSTVLNWDRENNGDTLSDLKNNMNVVVDTGLMYDHQTNYLRWAESADDGRNLFKKALPSNSGRLRVNMHFEWESYEASGVSFWAEDVNGNRYLIKCNDDGSYDYFNCGTDSDNGKWDGTFSINAPSELQYFYMASDMENIHNEWYDRSQLYKLKVEVLKASKIGTDTSVDGSGDTATYTWSGAKCTNNKWFAKAVEDDGEASSQSSVWNFRVNCEKPPNEPKNLRPSGNRTPKISANYTDPNGDSGTLYFETGSGSSIGSCGVSDGERCGVKYGSADQWGQQYEFQVYAEDSTGKTSSRVTQKFTVDHKPQVSNLRPSGDGVSVNPTLKAEIDDQDSSDEITVRFIDRDTGEVIGTDSVTGNGTARFDTSGVDFGSSGGTTYRYKVVADDGQVTDSATQSFTTNYKPSIDDFSVRDKTEGHSFSILSNVSDQDGVGDIRECRLVVADEDGNSKTYTKTSFGGSGTEAECDYVNINYTEMSGWDHKDNMSYDLTVEDEHGQTDSRSGNRNFPNHGPRIGGIDITDYRDRKAFKVSSVIEFTDDGATEIRSCNIVIDDGEQSYSVGNMTKIGTSTVRCVEDNVGPEKFSGITVDEELTIKVMATDMHGKTSVVKTLYNVPTGIEYDYTAAVIQS